MFDSGQYLMQNLYFFKKIPTFFAFFSPHEKRRGGGDGSLLFEDSIRLAAAASNPGPGNRVHPKLCLDLALGSSSKKICFKSRTFFSVFFSLLAAACCCCFAAAAAAPQLLLLLRVANWPVFWPVFWPVLQKLAKRNLESVARNF